MSNFLELALRCEAASGPDRELDVAIYVAVFPFPCVELSDAYQATKDRELAHLYTSSIDAALTLLPTGWVLAKLADSASTEPRNASDPDPVGFEKILGCTAEVADVPGFEAAFAVTRPLAIVAACLRARAATEKRSHE